MRGLLAALCLALALGTVPGRAQTFKSDTGLLTYTVRADRSADFERVVARLLTGLRTPRSPRDLSSGLSLRVLRGTAAADGVVLYVVIVDPPVPDVDYSLASLAGRVFAGAELDEVRHALASALEGATVAASDLRTLGAVTPLDRLRERIGLDLGGASSPAAGGGTTEPPSLDALRRPAWAVDRLDYQVGRGATAWPVAWQLELRNVSLTEMLNAGVVVELVDGMGTVLAESARNFVSLAPQAPASLSGTIDVRPDQGSRVATARVRVEPQ